MLFCGNVFLDFTLCLGKIMYWENFFPHCQLSAIWMKFYSFLCVHCNRDTGLNRETVLNRKMRDYVCYRR